MASGMLKKRKKSKQFPSQCCTIDELPFITELNSNQIERTLYCFLLRIDFNNTNNNKPDFFYVTDFSCNDQVCRPLLPKRHDIYGYTLQDNQVFQLDVLRWRLIVMLEEYDAKYNTNLSSNLPSISAGNINIVPIHNQLILLKVGIVLKLYRSTLECKTIGIDLIDYNDEPSANKVYIDRLYNNMSSNLPPYFFQRLHPFPNQIIPSRFLTYDSPTTIPVKSEPQNINNGHTSNENEQQDVSQNNPQNESNEVNNTADENNSQTLKNEPLSNSIVEDIEFNDDYFSSPFLSPVQSNPKSPAIALSGATSANLKSPPTYSISNLKALDIDDNKIYPINGYIIDSNLQELSHVCAKTYESGVTTDPILRGLELIISDSEDNLLTTDNSLTIYIDGDKLLEFFEVDSIELLYIRLTSFNTKFNQCINNGKIQNLNLLSKKVRINENEEIKTWTLHNFKFSNMMEHQND